LLIWRAGGFPPRVDAQPARTFHHDTSAWLLSSGTVLPPCTDGPCTLPQVMGVGEVNITGTNWLCQGKNAHQREKDGRIKFGHDGGGGLSIANPVMRGLDPRILLGRSGADRWRRETPPCRWISAFARHGDEQVAGSAERCQATPCRRWRMRRVSLTKAASFSRCAATKRRVGSSTRRPASSNFCGPPPIITSGPFTITASR